MKSQPWLEFKAKIVREGKTQDEIARQIGASRTAIRRAIKGHGCSRVRAKLAERKLITSK